MTPRSARLSKSDWLEVIQAAGTLFVLVGSKYVHKAKRVLDEFDDMKKKITTLENSMKAAWEKIDKLKKQVPHGGEI